MDSFEIEEFLSVPRSLIYPIPIKTNLCRNSKRVSFIAIGNRLRRGIFISSNLRSRKIIKTTNL